MQSLKIVPADTLTAGTCSSRGLRAPPRLASSRAKTSIRPHVFPPVRAVSEKERVVEKFSQLATEAAASLRHVADNTGKALSSLPSTEVLKQQTEQTAAELKVQAEQLREQAAQASSRLTRALGQTEEERGELLRRGNAALFSAASLLRTQTLTATSTLLQEADRRKGMILQAVQGAPEPIREIAETAVASHSQEAVKKGAVIHDFCLGITYGGLMVLGGLFWFIGTGSINAVRFGMLLGGILLAAAVGSMKAWQSGKSSTPYIVVQAVCAYIAFAGQVARFAQTGKIFPTAVVAASSIVMVAFYVYVVLAGGNPPSKKKVASSEAEDPPVVSVSSEPLAEA